MLRILKPVGIILALAGVVVILGWGGAECERERQLKRNTWRVVRSGEFARAEFGVRHIEKREDEYGVGRGHEIRWRYRTAKEDITTIYFKDGSSVVLDGQIETPFAIGSMISVSENLLGERCVAQVNG